MIRLKILRQAALWTELHPPQNSYVEALMPSVAVFGEKAYKEVIRLNDARGQGPDVGGSEPVRRARVLSLLLSHEDTPRRWPWACRKGTLTRN